MKNPVTPTGIKPTTFRFVAQHLNHCVTTVPCTRGIFAVFLRGSIELEFKTEVTQHTVKTRRIIVKQNKFRLKSKYKKAVVSKLLGEWRGGGT